MLTVRRGSDKVPDAALLVARDIVNSMLAARPDIRKSLIARRWRTGVIAEVEMTMDIPEYSTAFRWTFSTGSGSVRWNAAAPSTTSRARRSFTRTSPPARVGRSFSPLA
jgi:hypothetical protein